MPLRTPRQSPRPRVPALAVLLAIAIPATASGQQGAVHSPHGALDTSLDCSDCHTATAWSPARDTMDFSHSELGGFDLDGAHAVIRCESCHDGLRFDEPDVRAENCGACHEDVHQGTLDPLCGSCHNSLSFSDIPGLEIHMRTGFPLEGAHLQITCESCHTDDRGGAFSPLDSECFACHMEDYESAQSVDHVGGSIPIECLQCHTPLSWHHDVLFDHEEVASGFPLLGIHGRLPCAACHIPPGNELIFVPASVDDCIACHEADYVSEHAGDGYPTDCGACHDMESWGNADFDHEIVAPGFPLEGPHRDAACVGCHVPGSFDLIFQPVDAQDCIACHEADYLREHGGDGFPVECVACHSGNRWSDVSFDHDGLFFPIESGSHQGRWDACQDCHVVPGDLSVYSCIVCHTAGATDPDHSQVPNYVFEDSACLSCHPDGT